MALGLIHEQIGRIVEFNIVKQIGKIEFDQEYPWRIEFSLRCYYSNKPKRLPQIGDKVTVLLADNKTTLLSVRAEEY